MQPEEGEQEEEGSWGGMKHKTHDVARRGRFVILCTSDKRPLCHAKVQRWQGYSAVIFPARCGDTCSGSGPCRFSQSLTHGHDVVSHTLIALRHMSWYFQCQTWAAILGQIKKKKKMFPKEERSRLIVFLGLGTGRNRSCRDDSQHVP